MKIYHNLLLKIKDQRGATAVMVAVILIVLIGFAALAVDVGYLYATKNELQDVADAGALAGAGLLGEIYANYITEGDEDTFNCATDNYYDVDSESYDYKSIENSAAEVALQNKAAGVNITILTGTTINSEDIIIGQWVEASRTVTPTPSQPDAVKVTAKRITGLNGMVGTFFGKIFNIDFFPVTATATAALRGMLEAGPGELELPIGVSRKWFELHDDGDYCGDEIAFSPSTNEDACAGWNTWDNSPSNDNDERNILKNMNENVPNSDWDSPETISGTTYFDFINGDLSANTFEELMTLFQKRGYDVKAGDEWAPILDDNDEPVNYATLDQGAIVLTEEDGVTPLLYPDGTVRHKHAWKTTVVIYDSDDCTPSGLIKIKGFVEIELRDVGGPSDKTVKGIISCNAYTVSHGGGGSVGIKGSIPHIVN